MQVLVSPRSSHPYPIFVPGALLLPYGRGSQKSPRRASLSDVALPPQPGRSSPSPKADSNTSSTVRSDSSEAGRLRTSVHQWGGREKIRRHRQYTGKKKTAQTPQEGETNNANSQAVCRQAPDATGNGLLFCLTSFSPYGICPTNSHASQVTPRGSYKMGEELLLLQLRKCYPLEVFVFQPVRPGENFF